MDELGHSKSELCILYVTNLLGLCEVIHLLVPLKVTDSR